MGASAKRYTAEFRAEAVKQVIDRGHPVREVAARLGVSAWSLYEWLRAHRQVGSPTGGGAGRGGGDPAAEGRAASRHRGTRILKKATAYFAKQST